MRATVSEKGQVTIPKRLREGLGIRSGDVLEFHEEEGRLVGTKVLGEDPVEAVTGVLKRGDRFSGMSTDEYLALARPETWGSSETPG